MKDNKFSGQVVNVIEQMYNSRYFTNHGPLAQQFEKKISQKLGFKNAVAINSFDIALLIAINAQDKVEGLLSNINDIRCKKLLKLSGMPVNIFSSLENIEDMLTIKDSENLHVLYNSDVNSHVSTGNPKYFKNASMIEQVNDNKFLFQDIFAHYIAIVNLKEVFSQNSGIEGAVLLCDSDVLSEKFRNMRSSYGTNKQVDVKVTCNGRFSEFQAGIYLQHI
jgi:hypothetical protein